MAKHHMAHDKFSQLAGKLVKAAPPCMSSADEWEPTAAALEELSLTLEHGNPAAITPLPDAAGRKRKETTCAVVLRGQMCMIPPSFYATYAVDLTDYDYHHYPPARRCRYVSLALWLVC